MPGKITNSNHICRDTKIIREMLALYRRVLNKILNSNLLCQDPSIMRNQMYC